MEPSKAYSYRVISDIRLERLGLFHVETWIQGNSYFSSIFLEKKPITKGKESAPKIINDELYYIKTESSAKLIAQGIYGEPREVLEMGKIMKFDKHEKGILVLGEEVVKEKDAPFVTRKRKYRFDGRGLLRSRTSLYLLERDKFRKVLGGDFDVTDFATNGKRVVVATSEPDDEMNIQSVFELDVNNGDTKRLAGEGLVSSLAMNLRGDVVYIGHNRGKTPWAVKEVIFPEEGKSYMCGKTCGSYVLTDVFDGSKDRVVYVNDEVISMGQEGGSTNLFRIVDGKVERMTSGNHVVRFFDYDGVSLAYSVTTPEKPSLLYHEEGVYDPNPELKGFSPVEVKSEIQGWGIITGEGNPTILFIHGGPHMAYGYSYFTEFQFFASQGFNVLYANPAGSQGYGEEFARRCVGNWGGEDMRQLLQFLNDAKKQFNLSGKFGVTGGSYGGFMTNWIVTQTDVFSAAVSERSISNLVSMCGTSDIGFWFNAVESGIEDPWTEESIEKLTKMSPIYYVKRVKTPIMLIHGEDDFRCPVEQAEQFHVALRSNNVESVLVRYPGEGHEHARKGKPENMVHRLSKKLEWFEEHLKKGDSSTS
ncbi:S9 family peptidase [Metallosphaera tengchongensis]|uniref:S9 family peptidase n=1 Tax=Metallosphaera tengchongensis TaxID=1532350 RepID=A0A6N0NYP8_9CREN|nr:S9 family peptidase [Metallosphaera tengchongensis]QKR00220.1 S9 family peptidase [Metallosphaera tengchongensis]